MRVGVRLKIGKVRLESVEVDHRDGRLDLGQRASELCFEERQRAVGASRDPGGRHRTDASLGWPALVDGSVG